MPKIIHIKGFMDRFELPKNYGSHFDCGLKYFTYFVDPSHKVAKYHLSQIARLVKYDDPNSPGVIPLATEAVFYRLVAWSCTYVQGYRGFVFRNRFEVGPPATVCDIALGCCMPEKLCAEFIDHLVHEDLIEWLTEDQCEAVVVRQFVDVLSSAPNTKSAPDPKSFPFQQDRPPASGQDPGQPPGRARQGPEPTTITGKPVPSVPKPQQVNRSNWKTQKTRAIALRKQKTKEQNQPKPEQAKPQTHDPSKRKQGNAQNKSPNSPTKSEAGRDHKRSNTGSRPRFVSGIQQAHWDHGVKIFRALKMGVSENSESGKDEISSFAGFYKRYGRLIDITDIGLKEAHRLADKCGHQRPQYRARVWHNNMKGKAQKRMNQ